METLPPIPIWVLTGFLGSGKTALLSRLLHLAEFANTAVLINEIGEIAIDDSLIEIAEEDIVLLRSGCLCCSIGSNLEETLADLYGRRARGTTSPFERVVVETTGLADPSRIIQNLLISPILGNAYRFAGLVATFDAVFGIGQLERHQEVRHQVALADVLLITKTDLLDQAPSELDAVLRKYNQFAPILRSSEASDEGIAALSATMQSLPLLTSSSEAANITAPLDHLDASGIAARSFVFDRPLSWADYATWVEHMRRLPWQGLLRVKGILHIAESSRPVVVHAVHNVFSRPTTLKQWTSPARGSRIVVITQHIPPEVIEQAFFCLSPLSNSV